MGGVSPAYVKPWAPSPIPHKPGLGVHSDQRNRVQMHRPMWMNLMHINQVTETTSHLILPTFMSIQLAGPKKQSSSPGAEGGAEGE